MHVFMLQEDKRNKKKKKTDAAEAVADPSQDQHQEVFVGLFRDLEATQ